MKDVKRELLEAAEAVKKKLYVDDPLNSLDDETKATVLQLHIKCGGFTLLSNSKGVMVNILKANRVATTELYIIPGKRAQAFASQQLSMKNMVGFDYFSVTWSTIFTA